MTGEFFELLSKKSILKTAIAEPGSDNRNADLPGFENGVNDAVSGNLLHSAFRVRINQLFDKFTGEENFNYLSGLLIGTELKDLKTTGADAINLICGSNLALYYRAALQILHVEKVKDNFPPGWVDEAAVRGQYKIGRHLKILI
jgi:2-dehydro-3-deoxygalactonokinase